MNIFHPFQKVVSAVEAIVPDSLIQKYGAYAHTIAANLLHDAEVVGTETAAQVKTAGKALLSSVMAAIEQEAETLAPQVLSGKLSLSDAISAGVTNLKSVAAVSIVPGLKVIGQETLQTVLRTAASTAIATLGANPTSAPVSSPVASSPAS